MIVSLVRNNAAGRIEDGLATISQGFLSRPNRINVAVSRSMDRLVLVGAHQRWRNRSPMADLSQSVAKAAQDEEAVLRSVSEFATNLGPSGKVKKQLEARRDRE